MIAVVGCGSLTLTPVGVGRLLSMVDGGVTMFGRRCSCPGVLTDAVRFLSRVWRTVAVLVAASLADSVIVILLSFIYSLILRHAITTRDTLY